MNIWTAADNQTVVLTERFSRSKLNFIMENWNDTYVQTTLHNHRSGGTKGLDDESNIKQLRTLYNRYRSKAEADGTIKVIYRQKGSLANRSGEGGRSGRYFAEGSQSLQSITRPIRQAICAEYYWDIDMVNAHPVILSQYCAMNGITCPILDSYVQDREGIIERSGISKDVFKPEFLAILNGRQFTKHYRIPTTDEFFVRWNTEATAILSQVVKLNPTVKPSKRDHNENGSVTNKVICAIENKILFQVFNFLVKASYCPEVLCFDGLMIRQQGDEQMLNITLANMSDEIEKGGGYQVKFIVKPMTDGLDLSKIKPRLSTCLTFMKYEICDTVSNLIATIENDEDGYADLYYELYGRDNVRIWSSEPLNGYIWSENSKTWTAFSGIDLVTKSVSSVLKNHFSEQIEILENARSSDLFKNDVEAQSSIAGNIDHFKKSLKKIMKHRSVANIFRLAKSLLIDHTFKSKINNYEDVFAILGGKKINLRTLQVTDRTIADYFDHELDVNYTTDPQELALIDAFMMEVMDIHEDNKEEFPNHNQRAECDAFQVNLGYSISGCNREKVFFIYFGPGGNNSKSTVANFVENVFGKYAKAISRSIIEEKDKQHGDGPTPALMAIKGVHIGFIHETAQQMKLSAHDIKALTSGGQDAITGREMRCSQETFIPKMKPVILCNRKPQLDGSDQALVNRIRYIPFLNKFEPSPENISKVDNLKLNHRDAFFSWCVNGSHKYFLTGVLPRTTLQTEGTVSLASDNNTLIRFIHECCVTEEKTLNPVTKRYKTTVYPTTTFKSDYQNLYPKASVETLKTDMRMRGHRCDRDSAGER